MATTSDRTTPSLFTTLRSESTAAGLERRSSSAKKWFIERVKELSGRINRKKLLEDDTLEVKKNPVWGYMYMFVYDAKHKDTLPYYDKFPLIIMTEKAEGGFYGINLHYLHPMTRALFLDKLMMTIKGQDLTEKTRLRIRYDILSAAKKFREFKPCYKHYLTDQVRSKIVKVPADEWDIAIFLPTDHFSGARKQTVWKESADQYRQS